MMNQAFWRGRRVFITGHTGFKGGWLALWLEHLGAEITGFSLPPATDPNLFTAACVGRNLRSLIGDVREPAALCEALAGSNAEIVFHCAAQSLVRASYESPVETFATNVMGTVHMLEAMRAVHTVRAAVIVTSDKCYEEGAFGRPYRECDPLGGRDPYSSSKACAELVASAYRASFFKGVDTAAIATTRAGNVLGGGDWAPDRLVPDVVRACAAGEAVKIRYPHAVRPWQHVLEPLHGYLQLAESLLSRSDLRDAWNFGPSDDDMKPVSEVVGSLVRRWGPGARWVVDDEAHPREAPALRLDSSRARQELGWRPRLSLETALDWTVEWYKTHLESPDRARAITLDQIKRYSELTAS